MDTLGSGTGAECDWRKGGGVATLQLKTYAEFITPTKELSAEADVSFP